MSAAPKVRARPALGVVMLVSSAAMFAVNGTTAKLVLQAGIDSAQVATMRATGAAIGLFAVGLAIRPRTFRITRREVPLLAVYGLSGFFLIPLLYLVAIHRLDIGIALLLEYTATLFVALWARVVQRKAMRKRLWTGLALSLTGLACVAEIWGSSTLDPVGVAAGFGAAVLLAAYFLIGAHSTERRDPLSLTAVAWIVLDEALPAIQLLGGGLILAGIVMAETARPPDPRTAAGA